MRDQRKFLAFLIGFLSLFAGSLAFGQSSAPNAVIVEKWLGSPHADAKSPSFTHWNDDGAIPQACATCHSGQGFREFFGLDGSTLGEIVHPVPTGGVVDCATCHDGADQIGSVTFPSGLMVTPEGSTATCLACHQGRQSGVGLTAALSGRDDDVVDPELGFINPHYGVAAAMQFGTDVKGGYEYPGRDYKGQFAHAPPFSGCIDCHDPHDLKVAVATCVDCHKTDDPRAIRTSPVDFDGDGDVTSGIHAEVAALNDQLLDMIGHYAADVAGTPIVYADHYPYFFVAEDGVATSETFSAWTPALLRAAYNFQFVLKDKGAYVHNPHYAIQLLQDSITDLADRAGIEVELGARPL